MSIDGTTLAIATGLIGAFGAMVWSFCMAKYVAAPRAKRLIVEALNDANSVETKAVREALILPALEGVSGKIENFELSEEDIAEIGQTVTKHVEMLFAREQAATTKRLQTQLNELGLDEMLDEHKEQLIAQIPESLMQARRVAQFKVSKDYAKENPLGAYALELGKLGVLQMLENQGMFGEITAAAAKRGVNAGAGYNPGVIR